MMRHLWRCRNRTTSIMLSKIWRTTMPAVPVLRWAAVIMFKRSQGLSVAAGNVT